MIPSVTVRGVAPATAINLRLIVRRHGQTVNAALLSPDRLVQARPRFRFTTQESGDGHYLFVVPDGFLRAGARGYRLRIAGAYTNNQTNMGDFDPRGARAGSIRQTITLQTPRSTARLPLVVRRNSVSAMTISRLSVPMPSFLASVNQIGFDSGTFASNAYHGPASQRPAGVRAGRVTVVRSTAATDGVLRSGRPGPACPPPATWRRFC